MKTLFSVTIYKVNSAYHALNSTKYFISIVIDLNIIYRINFIYHLGWFDFEEFFLILFSVNPTDVIIQIKTLYMLLPNSFNYHANSIE